MAGSPDAVRFTTVTRRSFSPSCSWLSELGPENHERKIQCSICNKLAALQQYYRKLDKTQEWAENNYYHLPIEQQNADLITVNAFLAGLRPVRSQQGPEVPLGELRRSLAQLPGDDVRSGRAGPAVRGRETRDEVRSGPDDAHAGPPLILFHEEIKQSRPPRTRRRRSWSARTSSATATAPSRSTTSRWTSLSLRNSWSAWSTAARWWSRSEWNAG